MFIKYLRAQTEYFGSWLHLSSDGDKESGKVYSKNHQIGFACVVEATQILME